MKSYKDITLEEEEIIKKYLESISKDGVVSEEVNTLEEAFGLYINRVKSYKDITLEEEEIIKKYLESISKDGVVSEEVNTTITTLYWQV